ncbi:TadE family protein [Tessaracoccus sp. Y36]
MKRASEESGAAAVEFALVSMLLVALLMGILEFGYAFFVRGTIAGAAREGARVYAIGGNASEARDAAVQAGAAVGVTSSMFSIEQSCGGPATAASVKIRYVYPGLTGFFLDNITLEGQGSMRCNG